MGNQSQDEVFLAAQEAVGAHRDSQGGEHRLVVARGRQRCRICCETVKNKMDGNAKLTHLTCPPCNKYYCVHCFYLMHQSPLSLM
jgi:hypothetical protein